MPQKVIKFTGINRRTNEFMNSGACEELINLRPEIGGGHRVVKDKNYIMAGVSYERFYEHSFGNESNRIIVTSSGRVNWMSIKKPKAGSLAEFSSGDVEISTAGNIVVAYSKTDNKQLAFKYEDDSYSEYKLDLKAITSAYAYYAMDTYKVANVLESEDTTLLSMNAALNNAASGFYSLYPNGLCGAAVIGCSYELEDGSEVWSTAFTVANITRDKNYTPPLVVSGTGLISVYGSSKVRLVLSFDSSQSTIVKKINIYASRPVFPYEIVETGISTGVFEAREVPLSDLNLDGQLMYYQGSVSPNDTGASFLLNFGPTQAGEKVMEVTSGCIERTGSNVSYNNRFHFYNSDLYHVIQHPTVSIENYDSSPWIAYIKFDGGWRLSRRIYFLSENDTQDIIYPMDGIKEVAFVRGQVGSNGYISVPYNDMFSVKLNNASSYNYSYAFNVKPEIKSASNFRETISAEGQLYGDGYDRSILLKRELNALNVSAPFNPFVFPVSYSYGFGGEIIDVTTSYLPISSTQVGQYPLTVFTSNGIYSLEQGSGATLYGNVIPIQPLVIDGKATTTPYGTFFVSSQGLYILSGRDVADISSVLNGNIDDMVRKTEAYKRLCLSSVEPMFNFSSSLSSIDFKEFLLNAVLVYDQLNNEIIISNSDDNITYSYVFNLDTKAYHKVQKKYLRTQNGCRYVIEVSNGERKVVDLFSETDAVQPVLLQSRALSLDVLSTHIQRLMMLVDASLFESQNLSLSVFASDNLYDWKCIISSQKKDVVLRHIRTNRAAKSYKDYIFLINGTVSTDTDISDIIADYTVVSRRLG